MNEHIADMMRDVRRAALEEAARIAEASDTAHNNGTGHYRAGWHDARSDIAKLIRKRTTGDQSV